MSKCINCEKDIQEEKIFGVTDKLNKEWIISPDNADDYPLKIQERSLYSRYSWNYIFVNEKTLQKPEKDKIAVHSKEPAINTLKQYYNEKVKK